MLIILTLGDYPLLGLLDPPEEHVGPFRLEVAVVGEGLGDLAAQLHLLLHGRVDAVRLLVEARRREHLLYEEQKAHF